MITREQKVRVGIFFLIGILLITALFFLSVGRMIFREKKIYHIKFEDMSISGLDVGGNVKYHGITVGEIEDIVVSKEDIGDIIVTIGVDKDTPIKKDMKANLAMMGITGLKQIELTGGSNKAEDLPEDGFIETGSSALADITGEAQIIADKVELLLNNLNNFARIENQQAFSDILANTNYLLENNKEEISRTIGLSEKLAQNLTETSENLRISSGRIRRLAEEDQLELMMENMVTVTEETKALIEDFGDTVKPGRLDQITENIAEFTALIKGENTSDLFDQTAEILLELKSILQQTEKTSQLIDMTALKSSRDIVDAIETLNETLENLNEFSRIISEDPSRLIEF